MQIWCRRSWCSQSCHVRSGAQRRTTRDYPLGSCWNEPPNCSSHWRYCRSTGRSCSQRELSRNRLSVPSTRSIWRQHLTCLHWMLSSAMTSGRRLRPVSPDSGLSDPETAHKNSCSSKEQLGNSRLQSLRVVGCRPVFRGGKRIRSDRTRLTRRCRPTPLVSSSVSTPALLLKGTIRERLVKREPGNGTDCFPFANMATSHRPWSRCSRPWMPWSAVASHSVSSPRLRHAHR